MIFLDNLIFGVELFLEMINFLLKDFRFRRDGIMMKFILFKLFIIFL